MASFLSSLNPFAGSSSPPADSELAVVFDPPESAPPGVNLRLLAAELAQLQSDVEMIESQRLYTSSQYKPAIDWKMFRAVFPDYADKAGFRDNWMEVIINAVSDRMKISGFKVDPRLIENDDSVVGSYSTVWDAFRMNNIEEDFRNITDGLQIDSRVGIMVWPDEDHPAKVRIDWQPAGLYRIRYSTERRRDPLWVVKRWMNDDGEVCVTIYTPSDVFKYVEDEVEQPKPSSLVSSPNALTEVVRTKVVGRLRPREVEGESWPLPNPSAPDILWAEIPNVGYKYEIDQHITQQNAFDQTIFDLMIATRFAATRQRWAAMMGDAPEGGWKFGPHEVWQARPGFDPDGRPVMPMFGSFEASDPGLIIKVAEMWKQDIALSSRTPGRYFHTVDRGGRGDAPSGDAMLVDEQPLINKTLAKEDLTNIGLRRTAQLVAKVLGLPADIFRLADAEWMDPRFASRSAVLDEAIKLAGSVERGQGLGLPIRWVIRHLGLNASEIEDLEKALDAQAEEQMEMQERQAEQEIRVAKETQPPPPPPGARPPSSTPSR